MIHAREDYNRIQDPLNKIKEDEPVFLLRAQDITAPATLRMWARLNAGNGGSADLTQRALDHADLMERWQLINGAKPADAPNEEPYKLPAYPEVSTISPAKTRFVYHVEVGDANWTPTVEELSVIKDTFEKALLTDQLDTFIVTTNCVKVNFIEEPLGEDPPSVNVTAANLDTLTE